MSEALDQTPGFLRERVTSRKAARSPRPYLAVLALGALGFLAAAFLILRVTAVPFPFDPAAIDLSVRLRPPSLLHWLGTDALGRDVLTRMLHGTYVSLAVGLIAVTVELIVGILLGGVAGYFRGAIDTVVMRVIDAVMAFPAFFLVLSAVALIGPSVWNVMIVIGLVGWTRTARLVRAEFLTLRETGYVAAARMLGQKDSVIMRRHIFPNAAAPILVTAVLGIPEAILLEAGLSFLGFGVQPPAATWGNIIADAKPYLLDAWWLIIFPGAAIFSTALAFYQIAEWLRRPGGYTGRIRPRSR
jgi:peptide/nickel transport system permease protein